MFPELENFGKYFEQLYQCDSTNDQRRKGEWKKKQGLKVKEPKHVTKGKISVDGEIELVGNVEAPYIELPWNASAFAVFATARLTVLEAWMKQACDIYTSSSSSPPLITPHPDQADKKNSLKALEMTVEKNQESTVPKVVAAGLKSVFELIRESCLTQPELCIKALKALLDVIQGQYPETFKTEPSEVIDPLFDLLLDIATSCDSKTDPKCDSGNSLTAISCSCLLSLVTVRGETSKILQAITMLLMSPRRLALQSIYLPQVMTSLQKSVQSVVLEKLVAPDFISHGVPKSSKLMTFSFAPKDILKRTKSLKVYSMTSDGPHLYLHTSEGLFKIGSGYGGTIKSHIYLYKYDFFNDAPGWLGFAQGNLYFRNSLDMSKVDLICLDKNTFNVNCVLRLPKHVAHGVMFSDYEQLGVITSGKDDGFVVRILNPTSAQSGGPLISTNELPLKLARKCLETFGSPGWEGEDGVGGPPVDRNAEDVVFLGSGKEFSVMLTSSGQVSYCGKPSYLGMKQNPSGTLVATKWTDIVISKASKITQVALGHEGLHAIILDENGAAFFCGTSRRGEDGDTSKIRRQGKASKPKLMTKLESQIITAAGCNYGTTALVNREGELFMFGKDTSFCDPNTGIVTDLRDVQVMQVALGKAHTAVFTSKGHVYTFGINNKGQCGREFNFSLKESLDVAMETVEEEETLDEEEAAGVGGGGGGLGAGGGGSVESDLEGMCSPGSHKWTHEMCMVCTVCRECTGYSISCLSSMRSARIPGQECGCGEGDSGCSVCGCCRICAHENIDNSELAILGPSGAGDLHGMMRLDLIFGRPNIRLQEQLQKKLEERKQRLKGKLAIVKQHHATKLKTNRGASSSRDKGGPSQSSSQSSLSEDTTSDAEKEPKRVSTIPPARVYLPSDSPAVQVVCGLHHTVVLLQNGDVFTFGSNSYGQLGVGDMMLRGGPVHIKLNVPVVQIAAGSYHTVVLTCKGDVYTFGNNQKSQLARETGSDRRDGSSHNVPGLVAGVGPLYGKRAIWIAASGDQTFIKVDESLISTSSLLSSTLMANKQCIVLFPKGSKEARQFKCLVMSKKDGSCHNFNSEDQIDLVHNSVAALDPVYNVLWQYTSSHIDSSMFGQFSCYSTILSEMPSDYTTSTRPHILSCDLALPIVHNTFISRSHAAISTLAFLDTLTQNHHKHSAFVNAIQNDDKYRNNNVQMNQMVSASRVYSKDDYCVVNRFESLGGGWGYSDRAVEAIRFMADTNVLLGGFGMFGGRGEYLLKIKLIDIGAEGGDQEIEGEVLAETEEISFECDPRQKYPMLFDEPIPLQANRWYVAWAHMNGPSSDCGSCGQAMVTTEDNVVFYFKSSKKSNNGTDVVAGQIPQLLYRLITDNRQISSMSSIRDGVYILSFDFASTVTKECFQSLVSLLKWSWSTLKSCLNEASHSKDTASILLDLERLVYISRASLRLLRTYINKVYPKQVRGRKPSGVESVALAECIGNVRSILSLIFCDTTLTNQNQYKKLVQDILEECRLTFVSCYHVFYPTEFLKWVCLCDLLITMDRGQISSCDSLASAMLASMCSPIVRLRRIFPIFPSLHFNQHNRKWPSEGLNSKSVELHHYPVLVEQMTARTEGEIKHKDEIAKWSLKEVTDVFLYILTSPMKLALQNLPLLHSEELVNNCSYLMTRLIAELSLLAVGASEDLGTTYGRTMYVTPSRFTRNNTSRTWNTGNGSPDAICFSVDQPGIVIAGVGIYGGGGFYEYIIELLDDSKSQESDNKPHHQKWNSLIQSQGSYSAEDCINDDIVDIKFEYPVFIKPNVKYAIRLRNFGGRCSNGDGGVSSVRGQDGTNFSFSTCSLSFNGTTQTRGQIPYILYYSTPQNETEDTSDSNNPTKAEMEQQARKISLNLITEVLSRTCDVLGRSKARVNDVNFNWDSILGSSALMTILLPVVLSHVSRLATTDVKSAVDILLSIKELLPHVSCLNLHARAHNSYPNSNDMVDLCTTSHHYAWVESDHPYKPATVSNYRVSFPDCVKWLTIEFDPKCGTCQAEDTLQLFIPTKSDSSGEPCSYIAVTHKLSNGYSLWPQYTIVLPGNEVIFTLETASDYVKDDRAPSYGFKCLVTGYEWYYNPGEGLLRLESELCFLGAMCAASLLKKDLILPPTGEELDEDCGDSMEDLMENVYSKHSQLLSKGFALSSIPTIHQALDGVLPYSCTTNERSFLKDFVHALPDTSGGRLSRWLQPESYVDVIKTELVYNSDELRRGCPCVITLITKDQYGNTVYSPNMKIQMKAVPISKKECSADYRRSSNGGSYSEDLTYGGHPSPKFDIPYEGVIQEFVEGSQVTKGCFHSINCMKAYENYSCEELRFASQTNKRKSEEIQVKCNSDGVYPATWTPARATCYSILACIDGYPVPQKHKIEVKEPPQGIIPQSQGTKKITHPSNKLRKFTAKNSAGLRIRSHPTLKSEQLGVIPVNGTVAFLDEVHNEDGVWLRLHPETMKEYCGAFYQEAWCLQYNQHLNKTLLTPLNQTKPPPPEQEVPPPQPVPFVRRPPVVENIQQDVTVKYKVVKCGASGHNIRAKPSFKAAAIGMVVLGNDVTSSNLIINNEGTWVQLDKTSVDKYVCAPDVDEAWSLALDTGHVLYLRADRGSSSGQDPLTDYAMRHSSPLHPVLQYNQYPPGTPLRQRKFNPPVPSEAQLNPPEEVLSAEVEGGGRGGGAGIKKLSALHEWIWSKDNSSQHISGQSLDIASDLKNISVKDIVTAIGENRVNGNGVTPPETPKRRSGRIYSPQQAQKIHDNLLAASNQNVRAKVTASTSGTDNEMYQQKCSEPVVKKMSSPESARKKYHSSDSHGSEPQTSSSSDNIEALNGNYTTSTAPLRGNSSKKEKSTSKRCSSVCSQKRNSGVQDSVKDGTKIAMSPSVAESLRAIFAAFIWHEGVVHDAMACASYLKFHPTLPKQGALVVTRHIQRRASQRHSVEVSACVKPSTLETLPARPDPHSTATGSSSRRFLYPDDSNPVTKRRSSPIREEMTECSPSKSVDKLRESNPRPASYSSLEFSSSSSADDTSGSSSDRLMFGDVSDLEDGGVTAKESEEKTKRFEEKLNKKTENSNTRTVSVLPPALKCLVTLWEELTNNCLQMFSTNTINPDACQYSSLRSGADTGKIRKSTRRKKEWKNLKETTCELCGDNFPHPVTYHMRQTHPGCGSHAGGKGYNSGGSYCVGWAGQCGDGGAGGSSWYLICDSCRDKYIKTRKQCAAATGNKKTDKAASGSGKKFDKRLSFGPDKPSAVFETHHIMRSNALFLLELNAMAKITNVNQTPPDHTNQFVCAKPFLVFSALRDDQMRGDDLEVVHRFDKPHRAGRPASDILDGDNVLHPFHRSVSMGMGNSQWNKLENYNVQELDRSVVLRKRLNSTGEAMTESSVLVYPSSILQNLVPDNDKCDLSQRPAIVFIMQQHHLPSLHQTMKQSFRKATCKVFALQAFNWLCHNVTQPVCLHDIFWWFVDALTPIDEDKREESNKADKKDDLELYTICEHPLADLGMSASSIHPLSGAFHQFLQTIADMMLLFPMGSALQRMAMRCWGIRFTQADHSFLHRSKVFSNISKILSRSEEETEEIISIVESNLSVSTAKVECLQDLTPNIEIVASSRQAMVGSLTDGSTETFWESGEEDRNRPKILTLNYVAELCPHMIYVHIDNCRDLANKVTLLVIKAGSSIDHLHKIAHLEIEPRWTGWMNATLLDETSRVIRLELKGPDHSLRIRQLRVLGLMQGQPQVMKKQYSASAIQHRLCEVETLKVFRLIVSQVFGKHLQGFQTDQEDQESNDLKEHMVGILFSRSKLTHLQKQVCCHIVDAIRKEAAASKEDWEVRLNAASVSSNTTSSDFQDTYCFEMLSMVLALSGSSVGRSYLSLQHDLVTDLFILLHTGSPRVQRQVTLLLRRILPEVSPSKLASILNITTMPLQDLNSVAALRNDGLYNPNTEAILDPLLSCIAKSLTVQVKIKSSSKDNKVNPVSIANFFTAKDSTGARWYLKGSINRKLAEDIISLIKDMSGGKLGDTWSQVTKAAIAENIINLTRLCEDKRAPSECMKCPTLWLALASLCVLDLAHAERLSSAQWNHSDGSLPPRPTCANHDDGETNAVIHCNQCGNLCGECDRYLHMPRKARNHQRQVCKEEEEAIKVDLHEGCGRTKLFWILVLADSSTLKAMVEFREGTKSSQRICGVASGVCRFCGLTGTSGLLAIGNVCADSDCQEHYKNACTRVHPCSHPCHGIKDEDPCLPCLYHCDQGGQSGDWGRGRPLKQDADDMCMICFTEALACAPAIQLECGHVFHYHCTRSVLIQKWAGPRISFSFQQCPICKYLIQHKALSDVLKPVRALLEDVKRKAVMRLEYEGLDKVGGDLAQYAMDKYAYYVCFKCNKAYYGGEARCDAELGASDYNPAELVCGACSDVSRAQMCPKHGQDFLEYKCRYCCSVAVFFCFGTTHFCNACHEDFQRVTNIPAGQLPYCPAGPKAVQLEGDECPLHVEHPATGEEFALGCGICRNAHTF
uniref:RCR-type E3 ubiquitin transferase n=1 Tax=Cacopsylla melanoneura TaxID=428564 RepID=A0A8D8RF51_9HEMI